MIILTIWLYWFCKDKVRHVDGDKTILRGWRQPRGKSYPKTREASPANNEAPFEGFLGLENMQGPLNISISHLSFYKNARVLAGAWAFAGS